MNFETLIGWALSLILAWSTISNLDSIHRTILQAQSKLIYESRTETWGSPRFLR